MADMSGSVDRRGVLRGAAAVALLPAGLVAACGSSPREVGDAAAERAAAPPVPFSASFVLPRAGRVRLDFQDGRNFALSADAGPGSTIVLNGDIYLYVAPSIASAGQARLLLLGKLAPRNIGPSQNIALTPARPGDAAPAGYVAGSLFRADWSGRARQFPDQSFWVAKLPALAAAQYAAGTSLRDGMDMSLCGDTVARLIATWPTALAASGLAVVEHSSGIQLAAALVPLAARIALPAKVAVEDFRIDRR